MKTKLALTKEQQELITEHAEHAAKYAATIVIRSIPWMSHHLDDMVKEGILGLCRAAARHNGEGDFFAFATWEIRKAITQYIARMGSVCRIPRTEDRRLNVIAISLDKCPELLHKNQHQIDAEDLLWAIESVLDAKEREIVIETMSGRYGTLVKLATKFGVTKQTILKWRRVALEKLKQAIN